MKPGKKNLDCFSSLLRVSGPEAFHPSLPLFLLFLPDIVFFGENLPLRFFTSVKSVSLMEMQFGELGSAGINALPLSVRTSLAVTCSSSWERPCRSNPSPVLSAGIYNPAAATT